MRQARPVELGANMVIFKDRTTNLPALGLRNATPWSKPFVEPVVRSGLCDSRAGFGIQPSFPTASGVLRIPIDHPGSLPLR